ncbi:MAG: helix-turn-helix domain-containing protein [Planctomycetota bacterium]|nr:MAG: helix-turn-helix domain-containing protein [Planctomycetota bacterium]
MNDLLTPKQVARAISISESSIKRWCDRGAIATQYTPGGHRRIPLSGLLEFSDKVAFVLGGRSLHESLRQQIPCTAYCDNLQHLDEFAGTLLGADAAP